jgi:fucose 4-O-acetylase-like acetyltransferase
LPLNCSKLMKDETYEFRALADEGIYLKPNPSTVNDNLMPEILPADTLSKYFAGRMDILRFLAICSIAWGHALCSWADKTRYQDDYQLLTIFANQLGKFGSINFFLISGYFLNKKVFTFTILSYLKYRLNTIIIPWVICLLLLVVLQVYSLKQILTGGVPGIFKYTLRLLNGFIFHAAYWFIPVSILSALVLIIFKKYVNKIGFGGVLLCFTVFYSVNLYYNWVSALHTKAFLGYVLFMWLGIQLHQHKEKFKNILDRLSWKVLIAAFLLVFVSDCWEAEILRSHLSKDSFSSIRISNWILCVLFFVAILKSNRLTVINYLKPRQNVFGIYLLHSIVIVATMAIANKFIAEHNLVSNLPVLFLTQIGYFLIIMAITLTAVWCIYLSPLRFIIGASKSRQKKIINP